MSIARIGYVTQIYAQIDAGVSDLINISIQKLYSSQLFCKLMRPQVARAAGYGFITIMYVFCDDDTIYVLIKPAAIGKPREFYCEIVITEDSIDTIVGGDYYITKHNLSEFADAYPNYVAWLNEIVRARDDCAAVVTALLPQPIAAKIAREMSIEYAPV